MLYFERVNKVANIFFVFFLIITIVTFLNSNISEIIKYNFTNDLRGTIYTLISFLFSIFSLVIRIILKYIVRDATEEFKILEKRINND